MTEENGPSSVASPQGRRILIAVVTGEAGDAIQRWREIHDPEQAGRLPPHTTLCYWAPDADASALERQVRHAFAEPVEVSLGGVREFDNDDHTFYVAVTDTSALDEARARLYDGAHAAIPGYGEWTWHITCVRRPAPDAVEALREAANGLYVPPRWRVDRVAYMELRGGQYESLAEWAL